jgi:hypothetical protein
MLNGIAADVPRTSGRREINIIEKKQQKKYEKPIKKRGEKSESEKGTRKRGRTKVSLLGQTND